MWPNELTEVPKSAASDQCGAEHRPDHLRWPAGQPVLPSDWSGRKPIALPAEQCHIAQAQPVIDANNDRRPHGETEDVGGLITEHAELVRKNPQCEKQSQQNRQAEIPPDF